MNKRNAGLPEELQIDRIDLMQFIPQVLGNEVFTPEDIVENVLNCLPDTVWTNRDNKFLDIYTDNGEFLVQIYFKLMEGLKEAIPDPVSRRTHILMTQLYAVTSSTQLAAMTRRRLYNEFSLEGNIGVIEGYKNKMKSDRESLIGVIERMFGDNMKFDVIVGNPPYQEMSSNKKNGGADAAMPLYHHFVAGAMKLKPSYISMIIPSRWMQGGKSVLDDFRNTMVECGHITDIYNFDRSKDIFDDVDIAGGVMYFLYDANAHTKEVNMHNCTKKDYGIDKRSCKRDIGRFKYDTRGNRSNYMILVDNEAVEIVDNALVLNEVKMDKVVLQYSPFGLGSDFNDSSIKTELKPIRVICSKGRITYTNKENITQNKNIIDKWKVCTGYVNPDRGSVVDKKKWNIISKPMIIEPGEVCSMTYLVLGYFNTEAEAKNCMAYISTKFARYLMLLTISGIHMTSRSYMFVPVQDYSKTWTDQELYEKYNLSPEEIGIIENKIKAWE